MYVNFMPLSKSARVFVLEAEKRVTAVFFFYHFT